MSINCDGGEDIEGERKNTSAWKRGKKNEIQEWNVYALVLKHIMQNTEIESVLKMYGRANWLLIDDLAKRIYILPREMYLCGRKIKIELE